MTNSQLETSVGCGVLHLFFRVTPATDPTALLAAVKGAEADGIQAVCFSVLGHKADLGLMLLGPDWVALRRAQSALAGAGLETTYSYVSLTEVSEYA
ncbi:MAG: chlorite dismutase family protein, partial [Acidimicrobiales bacterium]